MRKPVPQGRQGHPHSLSPALGTWPQEGPRLAIWLVSTRDLTLVYLEPWVPTYS